MRGSLLRAGVLVLAACVGLACSDDDDDGTGPEPGVQVIQLQAQAFSPATVTIDVGTTVRWSGGTVAHTVTPDDPDQPGVWQAEAMDPGEVFEHTFNTPGTYEYHCDLHAPMTGTITVQ